MAPKAKRKPAPVEAAVGHRARLKPFLLSFGPAILAIALYLPSLEGGFIYDDIRVIVHNRQIRDLTALRTVLGFEPSRPLLNLTWALNYAVSDTHAWSYHLVNLLIHGANAGLLTSLFLWMASRSGKERPELFAALAAGLFAVSPMAVETVAYVSSRSTLLATLFSLLSLRASVRALGSGAAKPSIAGLAFLAAALATKEEAAAVPLFLLLLDFFFVASQSFGDLARRRWFHAPYLALPLLGLLGRRAVTGRLLPPSSLGHGTYLVTQLSLFPVYFLRVLLPFDPAFFRGQEASSWPPEGMTLLGLATAVGLLCAAFVYRHRWPDWCFAIAWLGVGLLPSSSLVPLREMFVDHRAYLAGVGILYAVTGLIGRWRWEWTIGLFAILVLRSWAYEAVLGDPVKAWEDAVSRAPRSLDAARTLGEAYAARKDPRAETAMRSAISLAPADSFSWSNLGVFYAENGRIADAAGALREAVRLQPQDGRLRDNLGIVLEMLGREEEGIAEFRAAVQAAPSLAQPRINLARALIRKGDFETARVLLNEAASLVIDEEDVRAIEGLRRLLK